MGRTPALVSRAQILVMKTETHLSAADKTLVGTIYDPPRAGRPWMLKDVLPDGATRYYSLARWALVDALRACGVGAGDRVLVPGLICREVLASINLLDATPVFYPVSHELRAGFSPGDSGQAKAVLAVNYFGFPQELDVFRQYCERTGAALIEDNAHGLLSRDENGRLLGSRGDAGVFSIRKTIAVPDGGALVLNGHLEMPQTAEVGESRTIRPRYPLKQIFRRVAGRLGPVRTHSVIGALRQLRRAVTGDALPVGAPDAETRIPVGPSASTILSRALTIAEPDLEVRRRRALYALAGRIIEVSGAVPVFPSLPRNVVPYGFPVFVSQAHLPGTVATVGRYGFQLSRWPDLPTAVASEAPEHYRHLMVLPFLW
jgi:hypothetical protein